MNDFKEKVKILFIRLIWEKLPLYKLPPLPLVCFWVQTQPPKAEKFSVQFQFLPL